MYVTYQPKPSFRCTDREALLITKIVARAMRCAYVQDTVSAIRSAKMDITACHCNGTPLQLEAMLTMPDADFGHDFNGIQRFMDRSTGRLRDNFSPRCSASVLPPSSDTVEGLDLESDTPLQSPSCALDGGPCESCQ